jgi:hypothetical protein
MYVYKEQVLNFMLSTSFGTPGVKLSHYDFKFMANIHQFIQDKNEITSNQASLFDALLSKYKKQLARNRLDHTVLKTLPWKCEVIESLPKFTQARVSYDNIDQLLTIELPYKKEFISTFRTSHEPNPWEWNRIKRRYEAKVSTLALMVAYTELPKFFPVVYYDEVKDAIDEVVQLQGTAMFWNPTYIKVEGKYMIAATNPILEEHIQGLVLDDSPATLYALSKLGIDIDESVHCNDPKLVFSSEYQTEYTVNDPSKDIDTLFSWISELEGTNARISVPRGVRDNDINKSIMDAGAKYLSVPVSTLRFTTEPGTSYMLIRFSGNKSDVIESSSVTKVIHILNQKEIKFE